MTYSPMGDTSAGNYSQFELDGTLKFNGTACVFVDLLGDTTSLQQTGTGVARNTAENTVEFITAANLSDYLYANYQVNHFWKPGSVVFPHIHFEQANNNMPNFLIRYRWQINGGTKTTAWTDYKCNTPVFTYVSGTLNQIAKGAAGITPPVGYSISDNIEIRAFRDNANTSTLFTGADPYTGTVGLTSIDIHVEIDTVGSRGEYTK
jgi:hypothetical protein